jgi:hypothetical protein
MSPSDTYELIKIWPSVNRNEVTDCVEFDETCIFLWASDNPF